MLSRYTSHPSSYRDPSGFLFYSDGILYRQVNQSFKKDFDQFINGGLYRELVEKKMLLPHTLLEKNLTGSDDWYQTLQPEIVPFISYPYEWCFGMLKEAALVTLEAALEAMKYNMMLKDASAYNLQWHQGKMKFIDSLSFEQYEEKSPWIAYRQFCEHFLGPLAIMHYLKEPAQNLFLAYPDGIPMMFTKKVLPVRSKLNLSAYLHIHLQAALAGKTRNHGSRVKSFSAGKLKNLLLSLQQMIHSFSLANSSGVWSEYYGEARERENYILPKKHAINEWISKLPISSAIDLGANEGEFSEISADKGITTVSLDFDHYSINKLYNRIRQKNIKNLLPLVADLSHPSPATGVNNEERLSLTSRMRTDLVMALAVLHHLAIGKNIPFDKIARMFLNFGNYLIVEFVPKDDEKISLMLEQKKDVYQWYTQENFLQAFSKYYSIIETRETGSSKRILYLMQSL